MFRFLSRFLGFGRAALLIFLVLGGVFVTFGSENTRLSAWVADGFASVLFVAGLPVQFLGNVREGVSAHIGVVRKNRTLRLENARLRQWRDVALGLEARVKEYEALLNIQPAPRTEHVGGRVVAETQGPFFKTLLVYAGRKSGVQEGQAALAEKGLVGRIVTAGYLASRVLLLSDLNSRVPVLVGPERHRAILAGDNTSQPRLEYLQPSAKVEVGHYVITSGHGGLLPPDLPVGAVIADPKGWRVHLFSEPTAIRYVRIVKNDSLEVSDEKG